MAGISKSLECPTSAVLHTGMLIWPESISFLTCCDIICRNLVYGSMLAAAAANGYAGAFPWSVIAVSFPLMQKLCSHLGIDSFKRRPWAKYVCYSGYKIAFRAGPEPSVYAIQSAQ